ncbi:MAG TPA: DUF1343 domain-containing protein [Vicinamibacteria bacterium]|nr:DUF1343 domain-containing protein [Vicinamibacteria bacterium]
MIRLWGMVPLACALAAAPAQAASGAARPKVEVGLERLAAGGAAALRGKRVGLVVHAASVTADGRHHVDVLRDLGVKVVRLFAPEHGLRSRAAAGESVDSGMDAASGLPVVSLYGAKTKPALHDLQDLDALVFDLQDAGVRFYTYASTLLLCLEAATEAGIEFVVLDRPNPLGGEEVEGPPADPREQVPASLVNRTPGPLVHGLTLGEMARYVNAGAVRKAKLTVIAMRGWQRGMRWPDTGRPWIAPSPNLRTPEAALAYPGVCLLEATNLSEGRGTEAPFLLLGAPWLKPETLAGVSAPGFTLEPARFTPAASTAAPNPKLLGEECRGARVRVVDPRAARPYELGLRLLAALRREPEFRWSREGALDWLLGTRRVREALERGDSVEAILKADGPALQAFRKDRAVALLYAQRPK